MIKSDAGQSKTKQHEKKKKKNPVSMTLSKKKAKDQVFKILWRWLLWPTCTLVSINSDSVQIQESARNGCKYQDLMLNVTSKNICNLDIHQRMNKQ